MLENLGERLQRTIQNIRGYGKISEANISDILREVRIALLEADVNYLVVKEFVNIVKEKALGEEVLTSLSPSEMFVKILKDELIKLLGETKESLIINDKTTVTMLVGLQGSGKTTTIGKIGSLVRKKYKKKPLFVACDIYRPAAIEQLQQIGKELDIEVYSEGKKDPIEIAKNALDYAKENHFDYIIIDTAGRLHVDEQLMTELKNISNNIKIDETLLVLDSMIGQDAINVIEGFNQALTLTGIILTKFDSDTRGGVAVSARHLTNVPIKLVGISEKMSGIEEFDPQRIISRILGEGDLQSLVEKAEEVIDQKTAKEAAKKLSTGKFDLEDFLNQLNQIKKLGSLENLIKMIPGASKLGPINVDPKQLSKIEAIILSMTKEERRDPDLIKASRKIRIAKGSGTSVQEVNRLLNQYEQMKTMMKQMKNKKLF